MARYEYFNRDLSWLSFNFRVLQEAMDQTLPLYERIKFLAIYSNNMEEFYQVRVSYYKDMVRHANEFPPEKLREVNPAEIIKKINDVASRQQTIFHTIFEEEIIPELRHNGIILIDPRYKLSESHREYIKSAFYSNILTSIQPVLIVKKKVRPFLKTGHVYLAIELYSAKKTGRQHTPRYAILKLPTDHNIPRFIELPREDGKHHIIFLEDIIMRHIDAIFPGYFLKDYYSIKLTRDADLEYDDYEGEDLIDVIEHIRSQRSIGKPNRFQYDRRMPQKLLEYLIQTFFLPRDILVKGGSTHNFRDFFEFPNPLTPLLEVQNLPPIPNPALTFEKKMIASLISKKDYLLSVPYQPYEHFLRFLREAAIDPTVKEIKATQYRVSDHSVVVNSLIEAAENGKKVTVFVELKARFNEEANLRWASKMTKAGISIIYSIPKLKVHAKLALVIRRKGSKFGDQVYLGTGNFNEKTARQYCDHGLFTSNPEIVKEVKWLYRHLEDQNFKPKFRKILVPGFNMIEVFSGLIEQETRHARQGRKGYILLKMNGLQDPVMVEKLYRASEAGVKIDLIIRGSCILKTGKPYSKNIRIIRIIDRFLEHARVLIFHNNGDPQVFLSSADWMKRNLYRRVECGFPVYDPDARRELLDILDIQLADNVKACEIDQEMNNVRIRNKNPKVRSQVETYEYFKKKYARTAEK
ncbi:MAG: polyphosphate kinase 1 [Bacteroidales bacterium]|nr:polyphosphate kinase 1 [Bacteroidales bacterium]MBN2699009.1 polyphosphate kinase 1 [Bacteroidales bacterium]